MEFQKLVATNIAGEIQADSHIPYIWTPGFQPISTRRVFIRKSSTRAGIPTFRMYPLKRKDGVHPPTFVLGKPDNKYLHLQGTHIVYKDERIVLFRPIVAIFYNMKYSIRVKDYDYILLNFITKGNRQEAHYVYWWEECLNRWLP